MSREPGLYEDIPNDEYHRGLLADPKPLSSSMAKTIVTRSPAEFKYEQQNRVERAAFDEGQAVHELVLEGGFQTIDVVDFDSWRTKAARTVRDESYAHQRHPILAGDVAPLRAMADSVRLSPLADDQFIHGRAEVSALARDAEFGIYLQARMDWLRLPEWGASSPAIIDLKTTAMGANPRAFNREIAERRYHLSMAFYRRVLMLVGYDDPALLFVAVDKSKPHLVSVHEMSVSDRLIGDHLVKKAIATYAACLAANKWPGHDEQIHITDMPAWASFEAEEIAGPIYEGV